MFMRSCEKKRWCGPLLYRHVSICNAFDVVTLATSIALTARPPQSSTHANAHFFVTSFALTPCAFCDSVSGPSNLHHTTLRQQSASPILSAAVAQSPLSTLNDRYQHLIQVIAIDSSCLKHGYWHQLLSLSQALNQTLHVPNDIRMAMLRLTCTSVAFVAFVDFVAFVALGRPWCPGQHLLRKVTPYVPTLRNYFFEKDAI